MVLSLVPLLQPEVPGLQNREGDLFDSPARLWFDVTVRFISGRPRFVDSTYTELDRWIAPPRPRGRHCSHQNPYPRNVHVRLSSQGHRSLCLSFILPQYSDAETLSDMLV